MPQGRRWLHEVKMKENEKSDIGEDWGKDKNGTRFK